MALKFGGAIRELRIHLCQTGATSKGVREFIKTKYVDIKKENKNFPILIRECSGIEPVVWARYAKGEERRSSLSNLKPNEVENTIKQLAN